ncbi:MAG: hypothetical protein PWP41_1694 [Moorella sp. (in: firmicutes)]|nr:hypothetical protein [Moorella sp. (in: firmicutes)]
MTELWGNEVKIASSVSGLDTPSSDEAIGLIYDGINDDELEFTMKVWDPQQNAWVDKRKDGTDGTTEETAFELVLDIEVDDEKDARRSWRCPDYLCRSD